MSAPTAPPTNGFPWPGALPSSSEGSRTVSPTSYDPGTGLTSGSNGDMAELLANICHPLADDAEGEDAADFSGASSVGPYPPEAQMPTGAFWCGPFAATIDEDAPNTMMAITLTKESVQSVSTQVPEPLTSGDLTLDPTRYKTALCRNWSRKGECPYGVRCVYAHGNTELRGCNDNVAALAHLGFLYDQQQRQKGPFPQSHHPSRFPAPAPALPSRLCPHISYLE